MRDQLPKQPNNTKTGIINLDKNSGPGTHWVGYAIDPRKIVYFDSYGSAPPKEFLHYESNTISPIWYFTLPTQILTDPPICGREILDAVFMAPPGKPPHKVVLEFTTISHLNRH